MTEFQRRVTPLGQTIVEDLPNGGTIEYEDFPVSIDVTGPMLYSLFHDHWKSVGLGHMVDGSVLELEFTQAPKAIRLYDGYLTVVTEGWHMHLCLEENFGGPVNRTPEELRRVRLVSRGALYRRLNDRGEARSWGIQFWNGAGEKMMNIFLPNLFVSDDEDLLPENRPDRSKLAIYEQLRQVYVLGEADIPYATNPLKRPFVSVCRSSRCNPSRNWQPVYDALKAAVDEHHLDVEVIKLCSSILSKVRKSSRICIRSHETTHNSRHHRSEPHCLPPAVDRANSIGLREQLRQQ
jgi:hypothetical protein